jgi:hypothetical protein
METTTDYLEVQHLYILNPKTFRGTCMTIVHDYNPEISRDNHIVELSGGLTFRQYNAQHNNELLALTWDEFEKDYYTPHLQGICLPLSETTEESFNDGLECLPPKRWTRGNGFQFFFVGECYTANIYRLYVQYQGSYYTALRPISVSAEDIMNEVKAINK